MKRRIIAMSVAFVLAFSVFAGVSLFAGPAGKSTMVEATDSSGNYIVVQIVPDKQYATFASKCGATLNGKSYTVYTYTPDDLNDETASVRSAILDKISKADLFVINQTGTISGVTSETGYTSFYKSGSSDAAGADVCWEIVYEIFKRIAGVDGTPARYIMDSSIFSGSDVAKTAKGNGTKIYAFQNPGMTLRSDLSIVQQDYANPDYVYGKNITKLYMMAESLKDPGTFYGIYFASNDKDYGINPATGGLLGYTFESSNNVPAEMGEYAYWNPKMLTPFALNGWDSSDIGFSGYNSGAFVNNASNYSSSDTTKRGFVYSGGISNTVISNVNSVMQRTYTIDRKTYRILSLEPNLITGNQDYCAPNNPSAVTRGLVYDFMKYAYTNNISLVGGANVTNMSMYQFVGDTSVVKDTYDCIYLGNVNDVQASIYRGGTLYSKYGTSHDLSGNPTNRYHWGTGSNSSYYPGLDISAVKRKEIEAFITAGKPVYYASNLDTKCGTGSEMKALFTNKKSSMTAGVPTPSGIVTAVTKELSVTLLKQPTLYTPKYDFDYVEQNGEYADYFLDKGDKVKRYVNTVKNSAGEWVYSSSASRAFNFSFYISDTGSSYTAKLYIDSNDDGRFDEDAVATKTGCTVGINNWNVSPVDSSFVGAVYWKLEISGNGQTVFKTGISAYLGSGDKKVINIIQIIPVEDVQHWHDSECETHQVSGYGKQVFANNMLLPMKSEMPTTDITSYNIFRENGENGLKALEGYFNNKIKIQNLGQAVSLDHSGYTAIGAASITKNSREDMLLSNAALFYYFMAKSGEYDINVLRVSTQEFIERCKPTTNAAYKITQSSDGSLSYKNPDPADSSSTISCDLLIMGLCRGLTPFGTDTDSQRALDYIENYVSKGQATYIGGGAISQNCNDPLTQVLRKVAGMDRYDVSTTHASKTQGYTYLGDQQHGNDAVSEMLKTNDSALTLYPYTIPTLIKGANARQRPYQLAIEGDGTSTDISVFYSIFNASNGTVKGYLGYGDVASCYYMYKKSNITYCAMGHNEAQRGQKAHIVKLPEAALLVNSIISAAKDTSHEEEETPTAPNIVVTNPDRSEVTTPASTDPDNPEDGPYYKLIPEDEATGADPNDYPSIPYSKNTEYLYPDYDFDKANASSSTNPELDLSTAGPNSYVYNNGTNDVIRVTFTKADGFEDNAYIKVVVGGETKNGVVVPRTEMNCPVYYYNGNTKTTDDGSQFNAGTECFIEIPLNSTYYNSILPAASANLYGIDKQENYTVTIETIPEGYAYGSKTDVKIVKRGIFTIN